MHRWIDERLQEHRRASGKPIPRPEFEAGIENLFTADQDTLVFGEETAAAAILRFEAAIEESVKSRTNGYTIYVTHGTILSLFIAKRFQTDGLAFWRALRTPQAIVLGSDKLQLI